LLPTIEEIVAKGTYIDAKSKLQEVIQDKFSVTPSYDLVSEKGPDHDKTFVVRVEYANGKSAEGSGKSKQEAEQEAAREVLLEEKWL
jgi:dsRNA-specific ribonuclease